MRAMHRYGWHSINAERVAELADLPVASVEEEFGDFTLLLLKTMDFLSNEFEEVLKQKLSSNFDNPVSGLESIADLHLSTDIGSPEKIAVWYAFHGNSELRKSYDRLYRNDDETYFRVVRSLCSRAASAEKNDFDVEVISQSYIGMLELCWLEILYTESDFDRTAAKKRCVGFLKLVFPHAYT